jgi:hypothetical protein
MTTIPELLALIKKRIQSGECDLRDVGKLLTGKWDQDAPAAMISALEAPIDGMMDVDALKAAIEAFHDPNTTTPLVTAIRAYLAALSKSSPVEALAAVRWMVSSDNQPDQYFDHPAEADMWANSPGIFNSVVTPLAAPLSNPEAPAAPVPVAWRFMHRQHDTGWRYSRAEQDLAAQFWHQEPLYATPPAPASVVGALATFTITLFEDRSTMHVDALSGTEPAELIAQAKAVLDGETADLAGCPFHTPAPTSAVDGEVVDELKLLRRIAFEIQCAAGPANDEGVIEKWATGSLHEAYKDAVAAERFLK